MKYKEKKAYFCFYHFFILWIILKFWILWNYLQNREMIKTSKPSFSYLTLAFSVICLLLWLLDEFHFHLKWYQSKWSRPLSCELFSTWNQGGKSCWEKLQENQIYTKLFLIRGILMVKKYKHENLKHTVKNHLAKKIKKHSHLQTITTNNSKHFLRFHIKQYWYFHWVTPE